MKDKKKRKRGRHDSVKMAKANVKKIGKVGGISQGGNGGEVIVEHKEGW